MPPPGEPPDNNLAGNDPGWAAIGNRDFMVASSWAIACLVVAAMLLLALAAGFSQQLGGYRQPRAALEVEPVLLAGSDLRVRAAGNAVLRGGTLRLTALASDGRALMTAATRITADDYAVLEYSLGGFHQGLTVFLIWRTAEHPERIFSTRLGASMTATTAVQLSAIPDWAGTVVEVGLDVYGDLRSAPLDIERLTLLPGSARGLLAVTRSAWLAEGGWSQRSINFLRGTPAATGLSPTVAAALWVGLAAILLLLARLRSSIRPMALLLTVMMGWLGLDLLWSARLSAQLTETRWLFSGKDQHDKQLADFDGELYRYAARLQRDLLPVEPATVFILKASSGHDLERLRLQYHLLPHNIYNFGQYPPAGAARAGDFILVLGAIPGLSFDEGAQALRWPNGRDLPAVAVDKSRSGLLYRVQGAADG